LGPFVAPEYFNAIWDVAAEALELLEKATFHEFIGYSAGEQSWEADAKRWWAQRKALFARTCEAGKPSVSAPTPEPIVSIRSIAIDCLVDAVNDLRQEMTKLREAKT